MDVGVTVGQPVVDNEGNGGENGGFRGSEKWVFKTEKAYTGRGRATIIKHNEASAFSLDNEAGLVNAMCRLRNQWRRKKHRR